MKHLAGLFAAAAMSLFFTPVVHAQSTEIIPGTQVRLTLVNGLSTSIAHNGDPFTAIVAEPVFAGNTMLLPAGAKARRSTAPFRTSNGQNSSRCSAAVLR
jgi:hypothetical protein